MELTEILAAWNLEKPDYEISVGYIEKRLAEIVRELGVFAKVSKRVKDDISLSKKLIRTGVTRERYDELSDKAGTRVVCRYREDIPKIASLIRKKFKVAKEEDMSSRLELDQFGYKSIHFDLDFDLKVAEPTSKYEKALKIEIQLRTLCDDAWAEISHDLNYKEADFVSKEVQRQVYSLGGLFEVADTSISAIKDSVVASDVLSPYAMLMVLEKIYLKIRQNKFSRDLSVYGLEKLLPLFNPSITQFQTDLDAFVMVHFDKIKNLLAEYSAEEAVVPFIGQPEAILIFYLIEKRPFDVSRIWETISPMSDLSKLSNWWGKPIEEYLQDS